MNTDPSRVSVKILEKEYHVACPPEERPALLESAEYLNRKMREIRDSGKVIGLDRIAVMAALNIVNELLTSRGHDEGVENDLTLRLKAMRERVEIRADAQPAARQLITGQPARDARAPTVWRHLRCSMRAWEPLDPNVKHPGARLSGSIVHVRLVAESLKCRGLLHLLLRVESNGPRRHRRVAPLDFHDG